MTHSTWRGPALGWDGSGPQEGGALMEAREAETSGQWSVPAPPHPTSGGPLGVTQLCESET